MESYEHLRVYEDDFSEDGRNRGEKTLRGRGRGRGGVSVRGRNAERNHLGREETRPVRGGMMRGRGGCYYGHVVLPQFVNEDDFSEDGGNRGEKTLRGRGRGRGSASVRGRNAERNHLGREETRPVRGGMMRGRGGCYYGHVVLPQFDMVAAC